MKNYKRLVLFFFCLAAILPGCSGDRDAAYVVSSDCGGILSACDNCNYRACTYRMSDGTLRVLWSINGVETFCGSGPAAPPGCGIDDLERAAKKACCFAGPRESCDEMSCQQGLLCVPNAHCPNQDPNAANVCWKPECSAAFPVTCGNYCCPADHLACFGNCLCGRMVQPSGTAPLMGIGSEQE